MDDEKEIQEYIKSYLNDFSKLNMTYMQSHFSNEIQCFFFGTAENEIFKSIEDIEILIEKHLSLGVEYEEIYPEFMNIEIRNNLAWCSYYMHTRVMIRENQFNYRYRMTLVLEKVNNQWFIRQSHGSAPQAGVEDGDPLPTIMGIQDQITNWITNFDISPDLNTAGEKKRAELKSYLMKARDIAESMEIS